MNDHLTHPHAHNNYKFRQMNLGVTFEGKIHDFKVLGEGKFK